MGESKYKAGDSVLIPVQVDHTASNDPHVYWVANSEETGLWVSEDDIIDTQAMRNLVLEEALLAVKESNTLWPEDEEALSALIRSLKKEIK